MTPELHRIKFDIVQIFDAYGRQEYTGKFQRMWIRVGNTNCFMLAKMEKYKE